MSGILHLVNNLIIKTKLSGNLLQFRTLQPIYTALEVSNDRLALQLCAKALKQRPNDHLVLVLKALALVLSKSSSSASAQEVTQLVRQVRTVNDGAALSDPDMITLLSWILSAIGNSVETPALLAEAVQKHPNNEQIVSEAFLQYIRSNDFKNAQQLGMRLQRDFRQQPQYVWWSVLAALLLVRYGQDPKTNSLVLALAERQVSAKYAREQEDTLQKNAPGAEGASGCDTGSPTSRVKYENSNEFFVVTSLLVLQAEEEDKMQGEGERDKVKAAERNLPSLPSPPQALTARQAVLHHFASEEGGRWCKGSLELEIRRRQAELRWGSADDDTWEKACARMSQQLKDGDTNWHTMLYLIRCAFAQADGGAAKPPAQPSEKGAAFLEDARQLFVDLADTSPKAKTERGFPLALLEIARETRRRKWREPDSMLDLCCLYYDRFSTKSCCFDDLKPYLEALSDADRAELVKAVAVQEKGDSFHDAARAINSAKVERTFGISSGSEREGERIAQYLEQYFAALPLGKGLPQTELQPADDFAILAAEGCVSEFHITKERSWLERAVAILECVLLKSKYRYQARILLINIVRLLGAPSLAISHFRALNLKSIQLDTLSHLVLARAATFGVVDHARNDVGLLAVATNAARFHEIGCNEATEMVVRSLHLDTYSKVTDFVEFTDRLRRSLGHQLASMETLRLQVVRNAFDDVAKQSAESYFEQMLANWNERASDNRDFKTLPNFQPQGSADIWEQTLLGSGHTGTEWLRTFVVIYSNFLSAKPAEVEDGSLGANEITAAEASLLQLSKHARAAYEAPADDAEASEAVLSYFKEQVSELTSVLEDESRLPWEVLHVAQIAFEGYCLLEIGVDAASVRLSSTKAPDHAKRTKQLRALRIAARDETKTIGAKLTNYGKKVGKERNKTVGNLSWLSKFPILNEDYLTNVAHSLVESRRAMAEGLGSAIHRKCSK
ncbi:hypothetical protein ACM66B_005117 [Microbotryomycetes sp. NB124-2]